MTDQWGKYMRVEVPRRFTAGTGEPENISPEIINLELVSRVYVGRQNTAIFELSNGSVVPSTTDFEVAAAALMLAQGPRPPLSVRELQNRDLMDDEVCDPLFVGERCLYCGESHQGKSVNHAFVSMRQAHR